MAEKAKDRFARDRILDRAEELFAQNGYYAVSVRQITTSAQCNLAAVNYHFGNKKNLYLEVFRSRWVPRAQRVTQCFVENLRGKDLTSLREILNTLARAFIEGPLTDGERERHHQLMAQELAKPIGALEIVANGVDRPFLDNLCGLLKPCMPDGRDEQELTLKVLSIFSMLQFFNFAREWVVLFTGCQYDEAFKERLIEHLTEFCSNGIGTDAKELGS